jgi:uncharacterized protein GlcG (DUF336 family)
VSILEAARAAVEAGMSAARERGVRVAVIVIDHSFTPVFLARSDGAFPSSVVIAQAKASTALNFGSPSATMAARVSAENKVALSMVDRRLMFVGGGVPIRSAGAVVAAVGVSGAREEDDAALAEQAAAVAEDVLAAND